MANAVKLAWSRRLGAAVCLPAAIASVLLGILPAPGLAARSLSALPRQLSLREQIVSASRQGVLTLLLYEGMPISGRFADFIGDWRDSTSAESRYEIWRAARPERTPRAGEALAIVVASGDTLRGVFEGLGEESFALRSTASGSAREVPFENVTRVLGPEGGELAPWSELREALIAAPVLAAVVLQQGETGLVLVSRSRIAQVAVIPGSEEHGSDIGTAVVVSVILTLVICGILVTKGIDDAVDNMNSCTWQGPVPSMLDRRFGPATTSSGPRPWTRGETRRP